MSGQDFPATVRAHTDLSRRTFLKAGIAGSVLLLAGRWLAPASTAGEDAAAGAGFTHLNAHDRIVLGRIVPVMLEGALPQDEAQRKTALAEIVLGIDATVGFQPPSVRKEIRDLFDLLNGNVTRAVIAGIWKPWNEASDDDVRKFLAGWRDSRFEMLRSAFIGLNNLIAGSWYGNPRSWSRIGYGGPPKIA